MNEEPYFITVESERDPGNQNEAEPASAPDDLRCAPAAGDRCR